MAGHTSALITRGGPSYPHQRFSLGEPWEFTLAITPDIHELCCVTHTGSCPRGDGFTFRYLNKGAANAVFTIHPSSVVIIEKVSSKPIFQLVIELYKTDRKCLTAQPLSREKLAGRVLRVPRGKDKTLSGDKILSSFNLLIKPLFQPAETGHTAAQMSGFRIDTNGNVIQATLRSMQGDLCQHLMDHKGIILFPHAVCTLRSLANKDVFVGPQDGPSEMCWAILLEDMSPVPNKSVMLEIKPKWLLQSPDAPAGAIRCRTCAMQTLLPKHRANYICPLLLLHGTPNHIRPWLSTRISKLLPTATTAPRLVQGITEQVLAYLTTGVGRTLLQHLAFLQSKLDPYGVLWQNNMDTSNAINFNLRAAMSLRDCSLFIKAEYDAATGIPSNIISKLGDLDFKSEEKTLDWAEKEKRLKNEGAYTKVSQDDLGCWLPKMRV